jgi:hypothetical protein
VTGLRLLTNPVRRNVVFQANGLPGGKAMLSIYNVSGQLVKNLPIELTSSTLDIVWNRTDRRGDLVRPGVYLYQFHSANATLKGKIVLVE